MGLRRRSALLNNFSRPTTYCLRGIDDMAFTADIRNTAEAVFAARKEKPEYVDYEFKDYKGMLCPLSTTISPSLNCSRLQLTPHYLCIRATVQLYDGSKSDRNRSWVCSPSEPVDARREGGLRGCAGANGCMVQEDALGP